MAYVKWVVSPPLPLSFSLVSHGAGGSGPADSTQPSAQQRGGTADVSGPLFLPEFKLPTPFCGKERLLVWLTPSVDLQTRFCVCVCMCVYVCVFPTATLM